jgi:saccharopine dehydrogenase-like NADP-dependent oxidoreductase
MNHRILIAGSGGIGSAAGLLLRELGDATYDLYLGDIRLEAAQQAAAWIQEGSSRPGKIVPFAMPASGTSPELEEACRHADVLLDCLPGREAPRMARLALEHGLHYANLTEHVKATNEIVEIAQGAEKGFVLQTGLAPGFINVLAHQLFNEFCEQYGVDRVDSILMRVGALTVNARSPHHYGFTWSPIGVAVEYLEDAIVVRNGHKTLVPALSERSSVSLNGTVYEEDLTSGGAADLPEFFAGRVQHLDYKTLRYPGHYDWVLAQIASLPAGDAKMRADHLQKIMEAEVPHQEDDVVVIYAAVQGRDSRGTLRYIDRDYHIKPLEINGKVLRAIQSTTASALVEAARQLLQGRYQGPVFQSQIHPEDFMQGLFVGQVYRR